MQSAPEQAQRVHFHLAENKASLQTPFAFLATYTTQHSADAKLQHLPLGRALQQYAGQKQALLSLLTPIHRAAESVPIVKELVNSSLIFQPLFWGPSEALALLKAIPEIETAGIVVRVPNWWNPKKPRRAQILIEVGQKKTATVGGDALLDFDVEMAISDGEKLDAQDWQTILQSTENLVLIKGQWVEVDKPKLEQVLSHWQNAKRLTKEGLSFAEAMRLLAGYSIDNSPGAASETQNWSSVVATGGLRDVLDKLREPGSHNSQDIAPILQKHLLATLRPYQLAGVDWLWLLYNMKLGGCLADDMGLGKTMQVLSLLLLVKYQAAKKGPHLLVLPASLLGNWTSEINRFAPSLSVLVAHSQATSFAEADIVMTTYGMLPRLEWLQEISFDIVILDEAQQIKNPTTLQTRAVKSIKGRTRFVLTGTPVENRLGDLWSLFDFACPGLLGSAEVFKSYAKKVDGDTSRFYDSIRNLLSPYILRRLKSDKRIISDLPDKTEVKAYCSLSKQQAGIYQRSVDELARLLQTATDIQRRGLVLSYLMRFKQICNHPSQAAGHGGYELNESGKFLRLVEICEEIAAQQEKVLVFTQFREVIPALADLLAGVFGRPGLVLHGNTPVKERGKLVEQFQEEEGPPFFVLSLKAGGTGLNLTRAAHVIHFDRWWNPAVENQATDRAYRIGQHKNVMVHKLICRGTIEEKIDALIESKKQLSDQILGSGKELHLSELSNEELMKMVALDIHLALGDA